MFGILFPLLVGSAYGYFTRGRQDKGRLFKFGALGAIAFAAVLNAIGWVADRDPATGASGVTFGGVLLSTLLGLVLFLAGVWLGDRLEARRARALLPRAGRTG